jgi:hypothetical protein
MNVTKISEAQIAFVLRQAEDGTATGERRRIGKFWKRRSTTAQALCGSDAVGGKAAAPARGGGCEADADLVHLSLDETKRQDVLSRKL